MKKILILAIVSVFTCVCSTACTTDETTSSEEAYTVVVPDFTNEHIDDVMEKYGDTFNITTYYYPGFPTDLQQPFMTFLTQCKGTSIIEENIYENRFMQVPYLNKMGAEITTKGKKARVKGATKLTGKKVKATDLRAGAAMVIAGLIAENKTTIGQVTYNDMTAGGTKAGAMIFGSHNETGSENYKYFRLTKYVVSCWQNKADSKRMVPAIVDRCKANEGHSDDYLFIIQTQLTPSFKYWFETACGWSVSDMNAKNNAKIIKNENFTEWISVMPVYLCDYSTTNYKNFNKTAMEKLKEYNLSLK